MKARAWMIAGTLVWACLALLNPEYSLAESGNESIQNAEQRENSIRIRVSDIMGEKVRNLKGDDYGTVGDMILHKNGTIDYIILLHGGILGMGESLVPVPWYRVVDSERKGFLVIDLDDELLKNAPSFSEEEWQRFENEDWNEEIKKYYGD